MIKCPVCGAKLSPYCTKIKTGIKRRYYKCFVCSHSFTTRVTESETIELNQNEKKADHKIHPTAIRVYHGLLKISNIFREVF